MISPVHHPVPAASGPLSTGQTVLVVLLILLLLWVAYKVGKVILRVVAGLLFLGLACYGIWYLFIR